MSAPTRTEKPTDCLRDSDFLPSGCIDAKGLWAQTPAVELPRRGGLVDPDWGRMAGSLFYMFSNVEEYVPQCIANLPGRGEKLNVVPT